MAHKSISFLRLKNQFAQKNSCNSVSKHPKSLCEAQNKTYKFFGIPTKSRMVTLKLSVFESWALKYGTFNWDILYKPIFTTSLTGGFANFKLLLVIWNTRDMAPVFKSLSYKVCFTLLPTWRSGCCYINKGECDLNQSKDDSCVKRVTKNNNWNNGDRHKIYEIFLINCFVFVIILVWQPVNSLAMTHITATLIEKTLQLTVPW